MYAIIFAGGKQHQVEEGKKFRVDLIAGKQKGDAITFDKVLFVKNADGYKIGAPYVEAAAVKATVSDMGNDGNGVKGEKGWSFKRRRRQGYHKIRGFRARYTEVIVDKIEF